MNEVYIGIGSNMDPERHVPAALRLLGEKVRIAALSTFYRTAPLGSAGSPVFCNGVAGIRTDIPARELKFTVLRGIEESLGRRRGPDKNAPRPIDLDILWYGGALIEEPDLVIPDPDILTRAFVAVPLHELAPALVMPKSGLRLADVAGALPRADMKPLESFTSMLREEFEHGPVED
jgi:2-amino-4-hydroxy-6-hydroxymethyldihydropteridine diphosphokinase